jgi:Holliday junction resolvase hjc
MTQYARGRRKEWDVVKRLRAAGWFAQRSAGSRGLWDVVAVKPEHRPLFVQVKYTKGGPMRNVAWQDKNSDALLALGDETKTDTPLDAEVWVYTYGVKDPTTYAPWQGRWVKEPASSGDW